MTAEQSKICVYCGKRMSWLQHRWSRRICGASQEDYRIWCKDCRDVLELPKSERQSRIESGIILAALMIIVVIVAWLATR